VRKTPIAGDREHTENTQMSFYDPLETRDPAEREEDLMDKLARQVAHAKETTTYYFQTLAGINPFECVIPRGAGETAADPQARSDRPAEAPSALRRAELAVAAQGQAGFRFARADL
jgi:hypothetical protein